MAETKTGIARWNESEGSSSKTKRPTSDKKRRIASIVVVALLCVASVVCFTPPRERIERGLWFKGGTQINLTAQDAEGKEAAATDVDAAVSTIGKRLGMTGVSESSVKADGAAISVALPEDADIAGIKNTVCGTGKIEFVDKEEIGDADALEKLNAGTENVQLKEGTYTAFMDGGAIEKATVTALGTGYHALTFEFNDEGSKTFADKTAELAENSGNIAIVVDGRVLSVASVSEKLEGGQVSVYGAWSAEEANGIKALVDTDELPVKTVAGEDSHAGALFGDHVTLYLTIGTCCAILVAGVVAFVRFRKSGLVVLIGMVIYTVLTLGMMAVGTLANAYELTLAGALAGVVCGIGTCVALWLIVSRTCNHVIEGGTIKGASITSAREGAKVLLYPAIVLFVVSCVLVFLPQKMLVEFGQMAIFGIVAGTISVAMFALPCVRVLAVEAMQKDPAAWGMGTGVPGRLETAS